MTKKKITEIDLLKQDLEYIKESVDKLDEKLDAKYTPKELQVEINKALDNRISRLEKILYGAIGIVAITVLGAILSQVIMTQ